MVDRSKRSADCADIVLFVANNNEKLVQEDLDLIEKYNSKKLIIFVNKSDLETKIEIPGNISREIIWGNTIEENGLEKLKEAIKNKLKLDEIINKDMSYLSNVRQIDLINKASKSLENAYKSMQEKMPIDMIEIDLKSAWEYLGELIGDSYEGELVDNIFSKFCLGK